MKNVLLATTAIALTAGYAAADVSYGASAKLAYGNFGTGTAATAEYSYANEFDFTITGSGEAGGIAYSGSMTMDEGGADGLGAFSMSSNGFTYAYDANDFGGLVDTGADGEDDDAGDWMLSYAGNGFSASYEVDEDVDGRYELLLGYSANGLSVGMEASDDDGEGTADVVNTVSLGYTMGALAIAYSADDQATQNYDVSAAYTMGGTVITAASDENEQHSVKVATTVGPVSITARTEQDKKASAGGGGAENELALSYTTGALTIGYSKDTGQSGKYGDEAETVTTLTYDLGGITIVAKGTDQEETEVSAAFSF